MAGHIITVLGGKGGVGKSQFAANLAFSYAQEAKTKVLLLDFDSKALGDQQIITGIKSKKTLKDLSLFSGAIDPNTLNTFLGQHPSNVSFLTMPTMTSEADSIDVEGLGKSLKAIPNIFPITVIDAGNELTPLALKALEYSTLIFLVVTPDILAVNQTRKMYQDLITMLFPKEMIQIIMNQAQKGHPVSPEVVGKQIGRPVFSMIAKDDQSCILSLTKSQPAMLIAKSGAFANGVRDTVRKLIQKSVLRSLAALNEPQEMGKSLQPGTQSSSDSALPQGNKVWLELKSRIHKALVDEIDLKESNENDPKAITIMREQTKKVVVQLLGKEDTKAILKGRDDMNRIVKEILDEALGLGPLEDMLADKTISEVMVVGPHKIYYEQGGKIKFSDVVFTNDRQVLNVIERIVAPIGRRIDEKTP